MKTRYPSATVAGTSSTSDYEQPGYDAAGNVVSLRQRDGGTIGFSYDNLNRRTLMDLAAGGINDDVTYSYDLLGRLTAATGASAHNETLTYDALGRVTNESNTASSPGIGFQYDLGGRRTRMTWSDGLYVTYDHQVTGEVTAIKENGTTALGTYIYDEFGRRTKLTRGNGGVRRSTMRCRRRWASIAIIGTGADVATPSANSTSAQRPISTRARRLRAFVLQQLRTGISS